MFISFSDEGGAADLAGLPNICRIAEPPAAGLTNRESGFGPLRYQPPFLLGKRGIEVQHERIGIAPEFSDDERHTLSHQACDERNVAGEAVQLRHQDRTFGRPGRRQSRSELWPASKRVRPFAGPSFDVLGNDLKVLGFGEAGDGRALRLDPKPRALLLPCRDTKIGNSAIHTNCIPPFAECMKSRCEVHVAQQQNIGAGENLYSTFLDRRQQSDASSRPRPRPDSTMVKALARAHRWKRMLEGGHFATIKDLAAAERINPSYLCRVLRLTVLAPDLVERLLDGRQPAMLQLAALLKPLPVEWERQRIELK